MGKNRQAGPGREREREREREKEREQTQLMTSPVECPGLCVFLIYLAVAVAPHCRTKIQEAGVDPHVGGGDLAVGMGGFRDQGVETGRFGYRCVRLHAAPYRPIGD